MRNLKLLVLLAPALLLAVACEDSSSSSNPFTPDAGPGFDGGTSPEAAPIPDAAVDSFVPPPAPKGVTVTVLDGAAGKKDVRVLFHDASGAVTGDQKTDASGKVAVATAPNMVTVLATNGGQTPAPVTFFAVTDGDNLVVKLPTVAIEQAPTGQYAVTFTAGGAADNASVFDVVAGAGCAAGGNSVAAPVNVDLYPDCLLAQNAVLATASGQLGVQGFGYQKNVAKPALGATVAVGPIAFTAPGTTKLTASHPPATASLYGNLFAVANGAAFYAGNGSGALDDGGLAFNTATGFAEAYQSVVEAQLNLIGIRSRSGFVRRETTTAPAAVTLPDFDFATALPFITNATTASPTAGRPEITLTSQSPLTAADAGTVVISWTTANDATASWTFIVPASSAASFKAPALPADAADFTPVSTVDVEQVYVFDATQLPGYKEAKALPVVPQGALQEIFVPTRPLPTSGTVRATTWSRQPIPR